MHWSRAFLLRSLRFLKPILVQHLAFRLNLTVCPILHPLVGDLNHRCWRICPQILDEGPLSGSKHSDYICGLSHQSTENRQQNPSRKLNCRITNTILSNYMPVTMQYMYLAIIEQDIALRNHEVVVDIDKTCRPEMRGLECWPDVWYILISCI